MLYNTIFQTALKCTQAKKNFNFHSILSQFSANFHLFDVGLGRVPRAPEYSPGQTITRVANQHPGTPYRTGFPVLTLHTSAALLLMASVIPFHRYQPRSDQFITAKVKTGQSTSQLCEPPGPYKAKCLWTAPGWPVTGCAGPSHTSLLEIDVYGSLRPRPLRFLIGGRCG